jgi:chemotaxis protein CheD
MTRKPASEAWVRFKKDDALKTIEAERFRSLQTALRRCCPNEDKMRHVIVVGDMKTGRKGDELVTHALGSCLGLTVYDPIVKVGGMLHAMLPLSKINPEKAAANPAMFVDTGVPLLFKKIYRMGGEKRRLVVKAAGCCASLDPNEMFNIGKRNYMVLKKLLWKNGVLIKAEDVGGKKSRTVRFHLDSGRVIISSMGKQTEL